MEVHRYEKIWIGISLLVIVGWIATVVFGAVGPGIAMVDDSGGQIADPSNPTESDAFRDPGVYQVGENEYEVYVLARQFAFQPGTSEPIRVPANSTVTFYVTSPDVTHGFEVVGTNVNTMVIPGQVAELTVEFDDPGRYGIVCNEYCGSAHHTMEGTIEVVEQDEVNGTEGDT
ncbi:cytochrome C oxidase subunit II [Halobacteriales archaeon QS_1_68_20]|nr:MAG: cytochrome C oxidase subunit II [Halobacteriales archaeon QS_1_68_20]